MKVRIALLIENIKSYFWIIPAIIIIVINLMLFILKQINIFSSIPLLEELLFLKATPEGARQLLSSISTSIMTVVGVMFSIIVVVIQQMSNQYTPRIVSNFARSSMAQVVLGFYVGTYIYCLILLMNIPRNEEISVPKLALFFAAVLAIVCLVLLILYIHHVTKSIQSTDIISNIARESINALRNVINDRRISDSGHKPERKGYKECIVFHSEKVGYVEAIDWEGLSSAIQEESWEIELHLSSGDFVQKEMKILTIWSNSAKCEIKEIHKFVKIHSARTNSQDPGYGLQKLTDISLRALSPGINDPSTAVEAFHAISSILAEFIRNFPMKDEISLDGNKYIKFKPCVFRTLIEENILPILKFGKEHSRLLNVMREEIEHLGELTTDPDIKHELMKLNRS